MKNYYCKRRAWQGDYWRHFQWYLRRWQQQEESCSFKIGFNSVMVMSLDSDSSSKPSQRIHEEVLFYQLISQWYQGQTVSRFQLQNFLPDRCLHLGSWCRFLWAVSFTSTMHGVISTNVVGFVVVTQAGARGWWFSVLDSDLFLTIWLLSDVQHVECRRNLDGGSRQRGYLDNDIAMDDHDDALCPKSPK